jgi:hypothetical protein
MFGMKVPVVKEWGSWVVFISSCLAAFCAALKTGPWETGRNFFIPLLLTIIGLAFLINSKNSLTSVFRTKGEVTEHWLWLFFFGLAGLTLMLPFLLLGIKEFTGFSFLIMSYIVILSLGREHHILAELNGFALLTLAAPIVYFVISGEVSLRLYIAVMLFFAAGVFKVRVRLKKNLFYRWVMVMYCAAALLVFYLLAIPVILLLPLIENIISVIFMREERLRTTGYTELVKGIIFIILIANFWR